MGKDQILGGISSDIFQGSKNDEAREEKTNITSLHSPGAFSSQIHPNTLRIKQE